MPQRSTRLMPRLGALALLLATLALAACAGPSRFGNVEETLAQDVGRMTYEEALDRWGEPTTLSQGGQLFTAMWERKRTAGTVTERMYLTFDNDSKVMHSYRYISKPFE